MLPKKNIRALVVMALLVSVVFHVINFGSGIIYEPRPALAAPVTDYEISIPATSAAYVDQGVPDTNTSGMDGSYLRVGKSTEFCYYYHSLICFHPIAEKDGGLLPDEANITGASVKLFKENTVTGTVNIYKLAGSFNENAVTWNTKPNLVSKGSYPILIGSMTLPTSAGWYTINIPVSTVEGWISSPSTNYGIAILPSWTNCKHIAFRSDETSSKPASRLLRNLAF